MESLSFDPFRQFQTDSYLSTSPTPSASSTPSTSPNQEEWQPSPRTPPKNLNSRLFNLAPSPSSTPTSSPKTPIPRRSCFPTSPVRSSNTPDPAISEAKRIIRDTSHNNSHTPNTRRILRGGLNKLRDYDQATIGPHLDQILSNISQRIVGSCQWKPVSAKNHGSLVEGLKQSAWALPVYAEIKHLYGDTGHLVRMNHLTSKEQGSGLHYFSPEDPERFNLKNVILNKETGVYCGWYERSEAKLSIPSIFEEDTDSIESSDCEESVFFDLDDPSDVQESNHSSSATVELSSEKPEKSPFKFSTFFPDSIKSEDDLLNAIIHSMPIGKGKNNEWLYYSEEHRIHMEFYIRDKFIIYSAFPLLSFTSLKDEIDAYIILDRKFSKNELINLVRTLLEDFINNPTLSEPIKFRSLNEKEPTFVVDISSSLGSDLNIPYGIVVEISQKYIYDLLDTSNLLKSDSTAKP